MITLLIVDDHPIVRSGLADPPRRGRRHRHRRRSRQRGRRRRCRPCAAAVGDAHGSSHARCRRGRGDHPNQSGMARRSDRRAHHLRHRRGDRASHRSRRPRLPAQRRSTENAARRRPPSGCRRNGARPPVARRLVGAVRNPAAGALSSARSKCSAKSLQATPTPRSPTDSTSARQRSRHTCCTSTTNSALPTGQQQLRTPTTRTS